MNIHFYKSTVIGLLVIWLCIPAQASIIFNAESTSGVGTAIKLKAELTISGDNLTVQLTNESPEDSCYPDDLLSSFYFDIFNGSTRPTLTYTSATGDVWLVDRTSPDTLDTANADLVAVIAGDYTWQFRIMDEAVNPFLGFGIGTVGNTNLTPNNFQGNIVDGMDYSIYKADEITNQPLSGQLLVKDTATFTFTGLTGFTENDIVNAFAFGLGTAPDSLVTPEPTSILLLSIGILGFVCHRHKQ